jgi:hypothetical protein
LTLQTVPSTAAPNTPNTAQRCANEQGFSLHADVCCAMNQRSKLEQLCRYITRPAIAHERLSINQNGNVVLGLKTSYKDGTTHVVMEPLEFMQRLAAFVPQPRLNLIRFDEIPPCISSFGLLTRSKSVPYGFVTVYWRPMPNCVPRSSQGFAKPSRIFPITLATGSRVPIVLASVGISYSSGCSISMSHTVPTVAVD